MSEDDFGMLLVKFGNGARRKRCGLVALRYLESVPVEVRPLVTRRVMREAKLKLARDIAYDARRRARS